MMVKGAICPKDMAPASDRVYSLGSASGLAQKLWLYPGCRVRGFIFTIQFLQLR